MYIHSNRVNKTKVVRLDPIASIWNYRCRFETVDDIAGAADRLHPWKYRRARYTIRLDTETTFS